MKIEKDSNSKNDTLRMKNGEEGQDEIIRMIQSMSKNEQDDKIDQECEKFINKFEIRKAYKTSSQKALKVNFEHIGMKTEPNQSCLTQKNFINEISKPKKREDENGSKSDRVRNWDDRLNAKGKKDWNFRNRIQTVNGSFSPYKVQLPNKYQLNNIISKELTRENKSVKLFDHNFPKKFISQTSSENQYLFKKGLKSYKSSSKSKCRSRNDSDKKYDLKDKKKSSPLEEIKGLSNFIKGKCKSFNGRGKCSPRELNEYDFPEGKDAQSYGELNEEETDPDSNSCFTKNLLD